MAEGGGDGGGRRPGPLPPPRAGARKRRCRPGARSLPASARSETLPETLPEASRAASAGRVRCLLGFSTQYSRTIFPAISLLSRYTLVCAVIRGLRFVSSGTISPYVPSCLLDIVLQLRLIICAILAQVTWQRNFPMRASGFVARFRLRHVDSHHVRCSNQSPPSFRAGANSRFLERCNGVCLCLTLK